MSEPEPRYTATVGGLEIEYQRSKDPYKRLLEARHRALMLELHEIRRQLGLPKLNERKR